MNGAAAYPRQARAKPATIRFPAALGQRVSTRLVQSAETGTAGRPVLMGYLLWEGHELPFPVSLVLDLRSPCPCSDLLLLDAFLPLVGALQVLAGFFLRALRVILGADREIVFVHRAIPLAGDIEDLAEIDARPHFGPLGFQIAVQRFAKFIGRLLIAALQEMNFGDAVMRQGAVAGSLQRFLVLLQRVAEFA